jgi:hypothetical protein
MKTYSIYENPQGERLAVKQGWSWPAFLFVGIWALVKKIWWAATLGFGVGILIRIVSAASHSIAASLTGFFLSLFLSIAFGAYGNEWWRKSLVSRGYDLKGDIGAPNQDMAIAYYLKTEKQGIREAKEEDRISVPSWNAGQRISFCANCGHKIDVPSAFCTQCGFALVPKEA